MNTQAIVDDIVGKIEKYAKLGVIDRANLKEDIWDLVEEVKNEDESGELKQEINYLEELQGEVKSWETEVSSLEHDVDSLRDNLSDMEKKLEIAVNALERIESGFRIGSEDDTSLPVEREVAADALRDIDNV